MTEMLDIVICLGVNDSCPDHCEHTVPHIRESFNGCDAKCRYIGDRKIACVEDLNSITWAEYFDILGMINFRYDQRRSQ